MITISDTRRRAGLLLAALAGFTFFVIGAANSGVPTGTPPVAAATVPSAVPTHAIPGPNTSPSLPPYSAALCGKLYVPANYYFYDQGKESPHAFGAPVPAANATVLFWRHLCGYFEHQSNQEVGGDWKLLRAMIAVADGVYPNQGWASYQWLHAVRDFVGRVDWNSAQVEYGIVHTDGLHTMYMTDTPYYQPDLHNYWKASGEPASDYLRITVHRHDGTPIVLELRLTCGFQPIWYDAHMTPKGLG